MHPRSFGHWVLYNSFAGQDSNIFGRMEQVLLLPIFGTQLMPHQVPSKQPEIGLVSYHQLKLWLRLSGAW